MGEEEEQLILNYVDEEIKGVSGAPNSKLSSGIDENQNAQILVSRCVQEKNRVTVKIEIENDSQEEDLEFSKNSNSFEITNCSSQNAVIIKREPTGDVEDELKNESLNKLKDNMGKKTKKANKNGVTKHIKKADRFKAKLKGTDIMTTEIVDLSSMCKEEGGKQVFPCTKCLYVGHSKANLERHSLVHLDPKEIKWFACTECPYKSKYEHQLKSHYIVHKKPEEIEFFQCPYCDQKCSRKHNLNNHIRSIHADRDYSLKCAECDYKTFQKERLVAHIKKHSREVFTCHLCKFMTKQEKYLQTHVKLVHTEVEKPFPCDTCSYKGKTKRELDRHYDRMHNKEKLHVYKCHNCSFNSIYKKNLEFHLLHMHQNSKGFTKFICGHCDKEFTYKNGLKTHIVRCHIKLRDEDWHKCMECKYKSKCINTLKRHIKRNHGAPRLLCDKCDFKTNRQISMDAHIKTHDVDGEDVLKCPKCPYRIIQMSSFLYHVRVIHNINVTPKEATAKYAGVA